MRQAEAVQAPWSIPRLHGCLGDAPQGPLPSEGGVRFLGGRPRVGISGLGLARPNPDGVPSRALRYPRSLGGVPGGPENRFRSGMYQKRRQGRPNLQARRPMGQVQ